MIDREDLLTRFFRYVKIDTQSAEEQEAQPSTKKQHDLAALMPGKVADLVRLLGGRLRAWDANMPVIRATGAPVPFPDELLGGLAEFVD